MRQNNYQPQQTSHQAYTERQAEIAALLKKINAGLAKHKRSESRDNTNWGYVGDLTSIAETLQELSDRLHSEGEYAEIA